MKSISGCLVDVTETGEIRTRDATKLEFGSDGTIHQIESNRCGPADLDFGSSIILPGFIDAHIHFPQTFATHFPAAPLLHWLEENVFPQEKKLTNDLFAQQVASRFCAQLVACGTTCAAIYGSQFSQANLILAEHIKRIGLKVLLGPTIMDLGAPDLIAPLETWQEQMEMLQELWKDEPNLNLSVIPRFVLSCSDALLKWCGKFAADHNLKVQTHINENVHEIEAVQMRFPGKTYSQVYDAYGLLDGALLAHNIHPKPEELALMAARGARVVHCASSNLFLGSGLFSMKQHHEAGVSFCLGTDVGAGTSFAMNAELLDVYKVQSLQGRATPAGELLHLATMAGAEALGLKEERGNFEIGKKADFSVWQVEGWLAERLEQAHSIEEQVFVLLTCGASPSHVFIAGKLFKE